MTIDLSTLKPGYRVKFRCGGEATVLRRENNSENCTVYSNKVFFTGVASHGGGTQTYQDNGSASGTAYDHPFDIIEIIPKREPIVGYLNVYEGGFGVCNQSFQYTKNSAAKVGRRYLSTLKITYDPDTKAASAEVVS